MVETSSPTVSVDERVELGAYPVGVLAALAAAYRTGTTGDWVPLVAVSMGLSLAVLFLDSD